MGRLSCERMALLSIARDLGADSGRAGPGRRCSLRRAAGGAWLWPSPLDAAPKRDAVRRQPCRSPIASTPAAAPWRGHAPSSSSSTPPRSPTTGSCRAPTSRSSTWSRTAARGHRTGAGHVYWEDETYNDSQVLLHIPKGFDIRRPSLLIVFFHGHGAKLADDVYLRQQVPAQLSVLRHQRGPGGAAARLQRGRIRAPASSGSRAPSRAFSARPAQHLAQAARRSALGAVVRQHAGGDRRLQRRLRGDGLERAPRRAQQPAARRGAVRRALRRARHLRRLDHAADRRPSS